MSDHTTMDIDSSIPPSSSASSVVPSSLQFLQECFPDIEKETLIKMIGEAKGRLDTAVQRCLELEASHEQVNPSTNVPTDMDTPMQEPAADGTDAHDESDEAMVSLIPVSQTDEHRNDDEKENDADSQMEDVESKQRTSEDADFIDLTESDAHDAASYKLAASPLQSAIRDLRDLLSSPITAASLASLRTLHHAITNVLLSPTVEKYRLIPFTHAKFRSKICGAFANPSVVLEAAKHVLELVGFEVVSVGPDEGFLLLTDERRNEGTLKQAANALEDTMNEFAIALGNPAPFAPLAATTSKQPQFLPAAPVPLAAAPPASAAASPSSGLTQDQLLYTPLSTLKKQLTKKQKISHTPAKTPKLTREQMAEKVAQRLTGPGKVEESAPASTAASVHPIDVPIPAAGGPSSTASPGRQTDFNHLAALRAQIASVRRAKHTRWNSSTQQNRKRHFGVEDLEKLESDRLKATAKFMARPTNSTASGGSSGGSKFKTLSDFAIGNPADCLRMGQDMLKLTNIFRAEQGKPPLEWNQAMHDIALVHSKNMAIKTVAFGHDGANKRFSSYPFHHRSAGENVAWSSGHSDVPKCHVDGWIKSPGHRANLLGKFNRCAIAVFRNSEGAYYSTQLFAMV